MLDRIMETVIGPTVRALAARGIPYRGILYAGLMLTADGPQGLSITTVTLTAFDKTRRRAARSR